MMLVFLFVVCILPTIPHFASAYCWQAGRNPYFVGKPDVQMIDYDKVRVSWKSIAREVECADQFLVKYWLERGGGAGYKQTPLVETDTFHVDIGGIARNQLYVFQAIAREDKGTWGVDYNKSEKRTFLARFDPNKPIAEPPEIAERKQEEDIQARKADSSPQTGGDVASPEGYSTGHNLVLIVGIIVAGVAVAAIIIIGVAYRLCRRRDRFA